MENSHLVKAHEHARNAATATYGNSIGAAGEAHALAAASFHEATDDTHDAEALRILALLEDHHRKLAHLIKEPPQKKEKGVSDSAAETPTTSPPPKSSTERTARTTTPSTPSSQTRAPSRRRLPHSSIASNLAEKRGIPGARRTASTSSSVSVTNALASRNERQSTPVRDLLQQQQSKKASETKKRDDSPRSRESTGTASPPPSDNFKRFYNAFGGVINAISAPLAFTSLPLNPGQSTTDSAPTSPPPKSPPRPRSDSKPTSRAAMPTTVKSSVPDLNSLLSGPALHALRDNPTHTAFAKNESFYFVPGTMSYASIVRDSHGHPINPHGHAHAHHAAQDPHLDSIAEGGGGSDSGSKTSLHTSSHEEFVDARESFVGTGPPSPTTARRPKSSHAPQHAQRTGLTTDPLRAGRGAGLRSMEELQLENATLRSLIDKQAQRLSMWEQSSQNSYNALAQSLRMRAGRGPGLQAQMSDPTALAHALGGNPLSPPLASGATDTDRQKDTANAKKIKELEALLAAQTQKLETLTSENKDLVRTNEKHAQVIGRYREQWEKLKAGARKKEIERLEKVKREAQGKSGEGEGSSGVESSDSGLGKALKDKGKGRMRDEDQGEGGAGVGNEAEEAVEEKKKKKAKEEAGSVVGKA